MKNNIFLFSVIVLLAVVLTLNTVIASEVADITRVEVNGIIVEEGSTVFLAGEVSETIPIEVEFIANEDISDVRVKAEIDGYRDDISERTSRFHIVEGSKYVKRFSLELPSTFDLDSLTEEAYLTVEVTAKGEKTVSKEFAIKLQRKLYSLNFLSVEVPNTVTPGSSVALDIVLENNGNEKLENVYVRASVPELGISKKVYFGDIDEQDESDFSDDRSINRHDSVNKRVYLSIPKNSVPGVYNIEVEAYNYDVAVNKKVKLAVGSVESGILPSITAKTISVGEKTTFNVVLVNPNDRMVVYSITPEESKGLIVEITEPIVAVPADSSKNVLVKVKATDSIEKGTHLVTVNVNSESGLERQVNFSVNVDSAKITKTSDTVLILTIVLAIIFVVLLVILIVLLTKKPEESEELSETSYY